MASVMRSAKCIRGNAVNGERKGIKTVRGRRMNANLCRASLETGKKDVLIVNTPSGGHAVLGYSLAKTLVAEGHAVSIMVPCEETSSKMLKPPFTYAICDR